MKIIPVLVFMLSLAFSGLQAQQAPGKYDTDSLSRLLEKNIQDTAKARICFLLCDEWLNKDTAVARKFAALGAGYSHHTPYLKGLSLLYSAKLLAYAFPDSAAALFMQADSMLRPFNTKEALLYRGMCWHDYARVFHYDKDDPETYVNVLLNKAVPLVQQSGDKLYLGKNYLDLSFGFKNLGEFEQAGTYLKRAIETLRGQAGNVRFLSSGWHTFSENYSLSGRSPDTAAAYMDSMRVLLLPYPDAKEWLDYYAGESMRLTVAERFDESLRASAKGIELAEKLKEPYAEQRLLLQRFYALYNKKALTQARDVALDLSTRQPFINTAANRLLLYYGLVVTFEELKNIPEAYKWLKRYSHLSDSLSKSNLGAKINALEIKFRNAEHQKKIAELNAANEKAAYELKRTRLLNWSLGIVSALLLAVLFLGYFIYRSRKKAARQQEQIRVTRAMLQAQEEERKRVARDLHDSLGGQLASIQTSLSGIAEEADLSGLPAAIGHLDRSIHDLRRIAHNMMPEMLLRLGLEAALKDLCRLHSSERLSIRSQCFGLNDQNIQEEQVNIYRIVQELLANAVKHAGARNILLQCNQQEEMFFITVEDDGKGFDASEASGKEGMGMLNIRNRVAWMNGSIDISQKKDQQGVSINIQLYVTRAI